MFKSITILFIMLSTSILAAGTQGGNASRIMSQLKASDIISTIDSSEYRRARIRASLEGLSTLPSTGSVVKLNEKQDLTDTNESIFYLPKQK
ncbi:MAG: hypothetical protein HRU19_29075 [Pseudobacteriovorax sp.]|nr:hypothetical protein [Pseudobacteriovorax sp.]